MRKMRKLLSAIIALLLVMGLSPAMPAKADETETISITYTSTVNDGDAPVLPTISSGYEFVGSTFIEDTNKNDTFHDDKVMVMDQATLQAVAAQMNVTPDDLIALSAAQGVTIMKTFRSGYNYAFTGQIKRSDNTVFSGADGDPFTGIIYVNGTDKTSRFEISDGLIAVPNDSGIIYECGSSATTKTLTDITITTAPATTTYTAGQNFDLAGMVVTATYSDNSTAEVKAYTVSPSGALATTDTYVTISYTEDGVIRTATQKITVSPAGTTVFAFTLQPADGTADMSESCTFTWALNSAPDSIELESFSTSGTGWGSIKPLTCAEGTMSDSVSYVSWYIIGSKSTYRIRATKGSDTIYSDVFEVKWTGNEPSEYSNALDCIEITTAPDTTAYTAGQKFDPAGMVITAKYFNAPEAVVTNYTISPSGGLATTDTSVTISYTEGNITKTATQKITVNPGTNSFKITFDANGHGTAPAAQTVESGKTATKPSDPTASGWTFGGWYTEATCANAFDFSKAIAADFTLYAKWTENKASEETTYIVTVGANGSVTQGSDMTITVKRSVADDTCFSHFTGVQIDGKACAAADYDAKAGSTVVTLKAATIENLSTGAHTITVLFDDGKAETKVTVEAKASEETDPTENAGTGEAGNSDGNGKVQSPKTGDDRTDFLWVLLILTALCACGVVVMNGKCRNTGA